jgi:hypothetical protein
MELGSYFLFLQEQIKDIIIILGFFLNRPDPHLWAASRKGDIHES